MKKYLTTIPFGGFYESAANDIIDREIEQIFEYNDCGDVNIPDEFYHANVDYKKMYDRYSRAYVSNFNDWFKDETLIDLQLVFESLESPREYNFTTDRIFCHIPEAALAALFNFAANKKAAFKKVVEERFTSRSGFISSYSNDVEDWINKPWGTYDHNEIDTLIHVVMAVCEIEVDEYELMESLICNGGVDAYECIPNDLLEFADKQREAGKPLEYAKGENHAS